MLVERKGVKKEGGEGVGEERSGWEEREGEKR